MSENLWGKKKQQVGFTKGIQQYGRQSRTPDMGKPCSLPIPLGTLEDVQFPRNYHEIRAWNC